MKRPTSPPVFLERRSYRQRRLMDALRLLPILGLMLCMLPVFWPVATSHAGPDDGVPVSVAILYVFGVWTLLIVAAAALWLALKAHLSAEVPLDEEAADLTKDTAER